MKEIATGSCANGNDPKEEKNLMKEGRIPWHIVRE